MSKGYGHYRNFIYAKYDLLGNVIHETYATLEEAVNSNNVDFVGAWTQNGTYYVNDLVSYDSKYYRVIADVSGSLTTPDEDSEHFVEYTNTSGIVAFIEISGNSGTLTTEQLNFVLASAKTGIIRDNRVYSQCGFNSTTNLLNFVTFERVSNDNYIYIIVVNETSGAWTRTTQRIVKESEVATDINFSESENLIQLERNGTGLGTGFYVKTIGDETILGDGNVALKTINGESIMGDGNIVVSAQGSLPIDESTSTTSENALMNKSVTNTMVNMLNEISYIHGYTKNGLTSSIVVMATDDEALISATGLTITNGVAVLDDNAVTESGDTITITY